MAVFEVKYAKSQNDLERSCEEAVAQIDSRMYGEEFQDDYSKVFCYGIFLKKTLSRSVEGVNSKKAW